MAQNDRVYTAGDRVNVWSSGTLAAQVEAGQVTGDGNPRPATVVREHPNEPGTLEISYDDDAGGGAYITDTQRLRPLSH